VEDRHQRIDWRFALIVAAIALVIAYGSLYPFHFRRELKSPGALASLLETWRGPFGRGDFVANMLLYLPLGLFSIQALRRAPRVAGVVFASSCGFALSVCIELLQFYEPARVSALGDVYANVTGVAVGSVIGAILFRRNSPERDFTPAIGRRPFVVLLLACWLGYRLFPFVPVIDLHKYWRAVKPLIFSPVLAPLDLYRHTMMWLAVALLLEACCGIARSRVVLSVLVLVVLVGRILMIEAALSPVEAVGGVVAVLTWGTLLSRLRTRALVIAVLFAAAIVVEALNPFHFNSVARPFGWIPFRSLLHGSIEVNVRSFLEKAFTYGALVWLSARAGSPLRVAVGMGGGLVLCLRVIQVFLPDRSAEITDLIMVLILAGVMKLMEETPNGTVVPQPGVGLGLKRNTSRDTLGFGANDTRLLSRSDKDAKEARDQKISGRSAAQVRPRPSTAAEGDRQEGGRDRGRVGD
jgi:VanZ family protein